MPVGVVVERRDIENPWQDYVWRPIAVVPNAARGEHWRELQTGAGWVHFLAATFDLELHRGETEGYKTNLSQEQPLVYVVLRQGEEAGENDVEPFHVTACPFEAMSYNESGDEIVEGVPMPDDVAAWVGEFADLHHVEARFEKRKNKRHKDRPMGSRPRGRLGPI
jgi:hypothetical protein